MENYIVKNDYKNNEIYNNSYNGIIENFGTSGTSEISETSANDLLLYKSNPDGNYDSTYSTKTLDNGETITALAHFLSITSSDWGNYMTSLQNGYSNVDSAIAETYYGTSSDSWNNQVSVQKQTSTTNYVINNNTMKDTILTYMEAQNTTWKSIYANDSDFKDKLDNYMVEKAAQKVGEDQKKPYEKGVSKYNTNTNLFYDNLRIDSRNKYINQVQQSIIQKDKLKDEMATADIMTKGREIQLQRFSFLQKKRTNQYYRISVFILGLCIIVLAIAQMIENSNKIIVGVVIGVILVLGLVFIIGKLMRDSKRYHLDYDEVNFPPYEPSKKNKNKSKSCDN
tara:strand:- start:3464 stop:4480 length:1017 start_codon:yes stop_codon:yes gene_type:complete